MISKQQAQVLFRAALALAWLTVVTCCLALAPARQGRMPRKRSQPALTLQQATTSACQPASVTSVSSVAI